jgi:hypothetical protein
MGKVADTIRMIGECVDRIILWIKNRCLHQGKITAYAKIAYGKG